MKGEVCGVYDTYLPRVDTYMYVYEAYVYHVYLVCIHVCKYYISNPSNGLVRRFVCFRQVLRTYYT